MLAAPLQPCGDARALARRNNTCNIYVTVLLGFGLSSRCALAGGLFQCKNLGGRTCTLSLSLSLSLAVSLSLCLSSMRKQHVESHTPHIQAASMFVLHAPQSTLLDWHVLRDSTTQGKGASQAGTYAAYRNTPPTGAPSCQFGRGRGSSRRWHPPNFAKPGGRPASMAEATAGHPTMPARPRPRHIWQHCADAQPLIAASLGAGKVRLRCGGGDSVHCAATMGIQRELLRGCSQRAL